MAFADGNIVIKEGYLELQKGKNAFRTFNRRYMIIRKNGIVDLFEKEEHRDNENKRKESFQMQGGEEIVIAKVYQNRFRFKVIVDDHKKKNPTKWCFGFESETAQKSWLSVFQGVLKQLNALVRLSDLMTGSNADTMEGQLKIGVALADCGQLSKARRIFTKLISKYGQESNEVHEQYETFLSTNCNDIHQAEQHYLQRCKFFCLPKEFITTGLGEEFRKISKRIEFMMSEKNKVVSQSLNKNTMRDDDEKKDDKIHIEYRNLENIWPNYLYSISTKNLKSARRLVKQFLKQTNRSSSYQFEYTYKEIEQQAWYIIKQCIDGKKGAVRLQARLEAVADAEHQKKLKSEKYATKFDTPTPNLHRGNSDEVKEYPNMSSNPSASKSEVFPSRQEYAAQQKLKKEQSKHKLETGSFHNRAESNDSVLGADVMEDILGDLDNLDIDFDDDASSLNTKKRGNQQKVEYNDNDKFSFKDKGNMNTDHAIHKTVNETNNLIDNLDLDFDDDDYDEDNTAALKREQANTGRNGKNLMIQNPTSLQSSRSSELLEQDVGDILDLKVTDHQQQKIFSGGVRSSSGLGSDDMFNIFSTIHQTLDNIAHHIYPWSSFMLIWITRRDGMSHIGDSQTHKEQLQCIQEFVYLFTRGCFQELDHHWDYALLLCTLYGLANDRDIEDVQYKMCLSGVRVIGDTHVPFRDKNAVSNFMKKHQWLSIVKGQNKVLAMRKYFLKGLRDEIQRIHDSLNSYYKLYVYNDKLYAHLNTINTKNNISSEINNQSAEKVQGKSTWGPRQHNKYDAKAFELVCQHRQIMPVPKPKINIGNFDECYMMFCLCLAAKLNPYFQKQIKIATKNLNCKHYEAPIKDSKRCYELMKHELSQLSSPKAARILDYCKCTLAFDNILSLIRGYKALDDKFKLCKIINYFDKKVHNVNNYKYMNVYIICKHPSIKFVKLICEVRLTLDRIQELHDERQLVKKCYGEVLHSSEIKAIMKEVVTGKVPKDKVHSPKST